MAVAEKGSPEILTRFSGSTWNDVSYVIKEDEDAGASDLDELDDLRDNSQHRRCSFSQQRSAEPNVTVHLDESRMLFTISQAADRCRVNLKYSIVILIDSIYPCGHDTPCRIVVAKL